MTAKHRRAPLQDRRVTTNSHELFSAIDRGNQKRITALIAAGCDMEALNEAGDTPLFHAIRTRRHSAIPILLAAGADPNRALPIPVSKRWERGTRVRVETPLSLATMVGDVASIELLLKQGARIKDVACEIAACYALWRRGKRAQAVVLRLLDAGLNPKSAWVVCDSTASPSAIPMSS